MCGQCVRIRSNHTMASLPGCTASAKGGLALRGQQPSAMAGWAAGREQEPYSAAPGRGAAASKG